MALRSVPGPLSATLVTIKGEAQETSGAASSPAHASGISDSGFIPWFSSLGSKNGAELVEVVLGTESAGAGRQSVGPHLRCVGRREHYNFGVGELLLNTARGLQTIHALQGDVHHGPIRTLTREGRHGLSSVGALRELARQIA